MNGIYLYFVNKHLSSSPLLGLKVLVYTYLAVLRSCGQLHSQDNTKPQPITCQLDKIINFTNKMDFAGNKLLV